MSEELEKLLPKLSPDELAAAKEILDVYLLLAWEIWEEHSAGVILRQQNSTGFNNPQLTGSTASSRIQAKVDSPHTNQPLNL